MRFKVSYARNNKGIALAFIALLLTVIIGLGAIVVDLAQAYTLKTKIKNAIDSAVLAGISQLTSQSDVTSAKNKALELLNTNLTSTISPFTALTLGSSDLSIQTGVYDSSTMTFTESDTDANVNAVKEEMVVVRLLFKNSRALFFALVTSD